ncbi:hypothetical protein BS78_02G371600 [Paspalum vaginatum]|nr:hypothetical protein BS78_02G371600 [Paspalum vaginatum]
MLHHQALSIGVSASWRARFHRDRIGSDQIISALRPASGLLILLSSKLYSISSLSSARQLNHRSRLGCCREPGHSAGNSAHQLQPSRSTLMVMRSGSTTRRTS